MKRLPALLLFGAFTAGWLVQPRPAVAADVNSIAQEVAQDLFAARAAGRIETQYIQIDPSRANLLIRNLEDGPVAIRMPAAFAGVPVLGQFGGGGGGLGGGGGGLGGGGQGGGGGGQAAGGGGGGGLGGGGGGGLGGGGGGGGGLFNIPAGRVQKVALNTVCLEHGKPDPNPRMKYTIEPITVVTDDVAVAGLCAALGQGQIAQNTAQAAAWHLMDKMSWEELSTQNKVESKYTGNVRWFNPAELRTAAAAVAELRSMTPAETSVGYDES